MILRFKDICRSKKIKIQDVADDMSISRQALSRSIKTNPTIDTIEKIAKVLNVDVIELIEPSENFAHFYDSNGEWLGVRKKF